MSEVKNELQEKAKAVEAEYSQGEDRPLGSYVRVIATYGAAVAGLAALVRREGGLPEGYETRDLALVGVASYKLSRMLAKNTIASPLRAPFTRFRGVSGPSELKEEVRGEGARHAVGELITCPFCTGQWVATAFLFGLVMAPKVTRFTAALFTTAAASDVLQLAYEHLEDAV